MKVARAGLVVVLVVAALSAGATQAGAKLAVDPSLQTQFAACASKIAASGISIISDIQANRRGNKLLPGPDQSIPVDITAVMIGFGTDAKQYWTPAGGVLIEEGETPDKHIYSEGCASLVHEGYHTLTYNNGDGSTKNCYYSDAAGQHDTKISVNEVNAVYAENRYRRAQNLPVRNTYMGSKLPPNEAPCEPKKKEPKPGRFGCSVGPVGASCAGSNGDPHLTTLDGFHYDLMAAGEFTLVDADAVRIQARQSAFPGSREVTLNTAVAADVAGDRVGVYLVDGAVEVHVDSEVVAPAELDLPNGGSVGAGEDGAVWIDWPDETSLEVRPIGRWGLSLLVQLDESHRGNVTGLLGNYNGHDLDDLTMRDGKPLSGTGFGDLYPKYADSWRISAQESLFDYKLGQNTDTFTDRTMPDAPIDGANLPYRDTAELICERAGVTDPELLQGCILDVALTGQSVFATDAAAMQRRIGTGDIAVDVDDGGAPARTSVDGTAGQRLFVEAVRSTLPDACAVLQLLAPDGARLATGCINDGAGYIDGTVLHTTGTYAVVVDPPGSETGQSALRMYVSTDQVMEIEAGGPEVTATNGTPGSLSISEFRGRAGQTVFVDVGGSTIADQCGVLQLFGPEDIRLGTGCITGGSGYLDRVVLPADGRYRIVVDPAGLDTGTTQLRLIAAVDQAMDSRVGASPSTATIDQPGAISAISFDGAAGQRISIDVSGSTLPGQCGVLELRDPEGTVLDRGCVLGGVGGIETVALPVDGRYALIVDPADDGVGELSVSIRG